MPKHNPAGPRINLRTKIALVIFGFFLFLILTEAVLRLSGWAMLCVQEYNNLRSLKRAGAYKIICVGESTTAGQYPCFLEEILNNNSRKMKFSVIDKGEPGVTTSIIIWRINAYLDSYRPDMVIAMMGINDWGKAIPYGINPESEPGFFLNSLRTYKLARLVWLHALAKAKEAGFYRPQAKLDAQGYFELGRTYRNQAKFFQAQELLKKAISLNPANQDAYIELGWSYQAQGEISQAQELLKQAIDLDPTNFWAYIELAWIYRNQGRSLEGEELLKQAIALDRENDNLYIHLGWIYRDEGELAEAERVFRKVMEINPLNDQAYFELGRIYRNQAKFSQAQQLLKKAISLNPANQDAYIELGWSYQAQGELAQAQQILKQAIELFPESDTAQAAISILYERMGQTDLAQEHARKACRIRLKYYKPATVDNYRKLREILRKRGIKLVCVQYPMRSIDSLKSMFKDDPAGIVFVDNEATFREAVKNGGWDKYFTDIFAGDFGHCTDDGNRLLAGNIAEVILKEVPGR